MFIGRGSQIYNNVWGDITNQSGDDDTTLTVETINNHIYFYSVVDSDRGLALIKAIREKDQDLRTERENRDLPSDFPMTPIWLHISSGGGDPFTGFAIADQIVKIKTPIYSIVEGRCASAATLISMSCTRRYIQPSSYFLIHQVGGLSVGDFENLQDDIHMKGMIMEKLVTFYSEKSNLSRERIKELLRRDSWFNAKDALESGFVDEIL